MLNFLDPEWMGGWGVHGSSERQALVGGQMGASPSICLPAPPQAVRSGQATSCSKAQGSPTPIEWRPW